jgi:DNA-binding MarR family transcriptional regulator
MNKSDTITSSDAAKIEMAFLMLKSSFFRKLPPPGGDLPASTPLVANILSAHYRDNDSPITVSEIADRSSLSKSSVSQILSSLEKHRIIRRKTSKEDKRLVFVSLTAKGKVISKRMNSANRHPEIIKELSAFLGKHDANELVRLMLRVSDFFEQKDAAKSPDKNDKINKMEKN